MVEFKTLDRREVQYGTNKFVEISSKKAITEDGDVPFISLSKGYYEEDMRRYKQTLTLPHNQEIITNVIDNLESLVLKGAE